MTARQICPVCETPQNALPDGTLIGHAVPDRWKSCEGGGRRSEQRVDDPDRPGYSIAAFDDTALVDLLTCHMIHKGWRVTGRDGCTLLHTEVAAALVDAIVNTAINRPEEQA